MEFNLDTVKKEASKIIIGLHVVAGYYIYADSTLPFFGAVNKLWVIGCLGLSLVMFSSWKAQIKNNSNLLEEKDKKIIALQAELSKYSRPIKDLPNLKSKPFDYDFEGKQNGL